MLFYNLLAAIANSIIWKIIGFLLLATIFLIFTGGDGLVAVLVLGLILLPIEGATKITISLIVALCLVASYCAPKDEEQPEPVRPSHCTQSWDYMSEGYCAAS